VNSVALLLVAMAACVTTSLATRMFGARFGFVSAPHPLVSAHRKPVPYLGGVAVAAGALAGLAALGELHDLGAAMISGGFLFLTIGFLDDLRPRAPGRKLALQAACAGIAISLGLRLPLSGIDAIDAVAGVLWIVIVVNAVNVTDVCDGLAAGLSAVALLAFALLEPDSRAVAVAVAGACLGFLVFNAPEASLFLGDEGSHFVGFCLAVPTLAPAESDAVPEQVVAGVLVLGVPLFELAFVAVVRRRKGLPSWHGSADHFSLRLQSAGLSRWQTDSLAWGVGCALAVVGLALIHVDAAARIALVAVAAAGLVAAWWQLLKYEPEASLRELRRPASRA
jgi:UDP-GlcNAc:undecaprenyl-phosphate/decaprenyl-phosphate GlcNAc-1-phosphate transferase